jgi:hypothetical protein
MTPKFEGVQIGAAKYSESTRYVIKCELKNLRVVFEKQLNTPESIVDTEGFGFYCGDRFKDDMYVITILESAIAEKDLKSNPIENMWKALKFCASTDYWYMFEKQ